MLQTRLWSQQRFFSTGGDGPDATPKASRVFEYKAPADDKSTDFESTRIFFRRYFILFPFAAYALYKMSFCRRNPVSNREEWKLFNQTFEERVVAPRVQRWLRQSFDGKVYRKDVSEVRLVEDVWRRLVSA